MSLRAATDRARWMISARIAPRAERVTVRNESTRTVLKLLRGVGLKAVLVSAGDADLYHRTHRLFEGNSSPFSARIVATGAKPVTPVLTILAMMGMREDDLRVLVRGSHRTFCFDPDLLGAIAPHIAVGPSISPSQGHCRAGSGRCHYCGRRDGFTVDHIVPRSVGGRDVWWNTTSSCAPCNTAKGNRNPECECEYCARAVALYLGGYRNA